MERGLDRSCSQSSFTPKTGRARRRKCDEHYPTCLACAKRHLSCTYPQGPPNTGNVNNGRHAQQRQPLVPKSTALPVIQRPAPVPIRPRRQDSPAPLKLVAELSLDIDQGLINHYTSRLCSLLLDRHAHPDYERLFLQSSILPKLQFMVEPLLACASLDLSRRFPAYRPLALAYYAQAVTRTRNIIEGKTVRGTEDWLLFNVLHLNLFETWNSDATPDTTPVLLHIQGAAQILKLKLKGDGVSLTQLASTSGKVIARIAAEAFVYHTVNWSMFHGNPIPITTMPVAELWDTLQPYLDLRPFPEASDAENSPVLGVPWQLYRFLSDLALVSHRGPPIDNEQDAALVRRLSKDLEGWAAKEVKRPSSQTSPQYRQRTRLFVISLKLLILKLLHADISTTDCKVQNLVGQATALIISKDPTNRQGTALERTDFWPLLVVGSAVVDKTQISIVRATLETMAETMYSVAFIKTKRALETIWDATTKDDEDNQDRPDGLTMLLGGRGVPGLIQGDAR